MTEQTQPENEQTPEPSAGREAAKYRRQLREVEAERDALSTALTATRQTLLDQGLADYIDVEYTPTEGNIAVTPDLHPKPVTAKIRLKHVTDFATFSGETVETLLDEEGTFDQAKVHAALVKLWQDRPELFDDATPGNVPTIGDTPSRPMKVGDNFTAAFRPKKQGA